MVEAGPKLRECLTSFSGQLVVGSNLQQRLDRLKNFRCPLALITYSVVGRTARVFISR